MVIFKKLSYNLPIIFVILMSIIILFINKKYIEFFEMFKKPGWTINFIIIIFFMIFIKLFRNDDINLIEASKKSILVMIIAIFGHLDMTIAPFWIVFFLAYFANGFI